MDWLRKETSQLLEGIYIKFTSIQLLLIKEVISSTAKDFYKDHQNYR